MTRVNIVASNISDKDTPSGMKTVTTETQKITGETLVNAWDSVIGKMHKRTSVVDDLPRGPSYMSLKDLKRFNRERAWTRENTQTVKPKKSLNEMKVICRTYLYSIKDFLSRINLVLTNDFSDNSTISADKVTEVIDSLELSFNSLKNSSVLFNSYVSEFVHLLPSDLVVLLTRLSEEKFTLNIWRLYKNLMTYLINYRSELGNDDRNYSKSKSYIVDIISQINSYWSQLLSWIDSLPEGIFSSTKKLSKGSKR